MMTSDSSYKYSGSNDGSYFNLYRSSRHSSSSSVATLPPIHPPPRSNSTPSVIQSSSSSSLRKIGFSTSSGHPPSESSRSKIASIPNSQSQIQLRPHSPPPKLRNSYTFTPLHSRKPFPPAHESSNSLNRQQRKRGQWWSSPNERENEIIQIKEQLRKSVIQEPLVSQNNQSQHLHQSRSQSNSLFNSTSQSSSVSIPDESRPAQSNSGASLISPRIRRTISGGCVIQSSSVDDGFQRISNTPANSSSELSKSNEYSGNHAEMINRINSLESKIQNTEPILESYKKLFKVISDIGDQRVHLLHN
ncbi:hypothetical protein BKA69DRAFT_857282 [Paraphysoderma sedebokerense]|nr:hypothetical protein BKA69DRAFT_857282 [Paraphysoderma sedebokerense]